MLDELLFSPEAATRTSEYKHSIMQLMEMGNNIFFKCKYEGKLMYY